MHIVRGRFNGYPLAFFVIMLANVFFFFSFQGIFPVLPRFIADVVLRQPPGRVGGQVGLATTVLALVAVLTRIPAGRLTDLWGQRRFMLFGALCFTVAPLIYAVSQSMPLLLLGRLMHGLGLGTFTTAFQAFITELSPAGRRGEALGLAGASSSVAFVTAPLVGDWLAANRGYLLLFNVSAAAAAISVVLTALAWAYRPQSDGGGSTESPRVTGGSHSPVARPSLAQVDEEMLAGLRMTLAQKGVQASILTMAALGIPFGAFITFLPLFAEERQITGVGVVFSVYAAIILLAQPLSGWLSDRAGRSAVILPGLIITSLATVFLALDGALWVFVLAGGLLGMGSGLTRGGIDALTQDSVSPALRGTAAAVQYTSFDFWIGLGSYPVGLLANTWGYAMTFGAAGLLCLLGSGALALMSRD